MKGGGGGGINGGVIISWLSISSTKTSGEIMQRS
jgi:hypothetical protein